MINRFNPYSLIVGGPFLLVILFVLVIPWSWSAEVTIGSKKFTESVILGEIVSHLAPNSGIQAIHKRELGGTRILWNALLKGDIDLYPEYTGTISQEILAGQGIHGFEAISRCLREKGILVTRPLGFNNTYIIGMKDNRAAELGVSRISDLRLHPGLRLGFSNEFMDRGDGWPGLRETYQLPHSDVRGLDHDLAYRGLETGTIDAIDLYSTDAEIQYYGLRKLKDDLTYFPEYYAIIVYRQEIARKFPELVARLALLEGNMSDQDMVRLNARSKLDKVPEVQVAADYVARTFALTSKVEVESTMDRFLKHSREHLILVIISLSAAIIISLPLGIIAAKRMKLGQVILGAVGVVQTIPSLALLVFMIPLLGIGGPPALLALFLYSLLPIVRNTYSGLRDIPLAIRESAEALGLPVYARLMRIELPIASRTILAGIKTAAVINVGTATLGALIGAGGYGQPILTGIRLDDVGLILQGAIPAAGLALLVQSGFDLLDKIVIPKGLRITSAA